MASLNEVLYGAPQFPVTQANPEMLPQMPEAFSPTALEQTQQQMQAPQSPTADVVKPQGKSKWDDPNRWMIAAAALASHNPLQMLPLGLMAYDQLTGAQERESVMANQEAARKAQETTSLVDYRTASTEQTRQTTGEARQTEASKVSRAKAEATKAEAEAALKQSEVDVLKALEAQDPGAVIRAQEKLSALRLANEGKEQDIKQSKAAVASSYASAAANSAVAKARETLMDPTASQEMKDAALSVVHGRSQTAEQKDKAKWIEERLKRANPTWTDAQLAQATLDYEGTRKGQELDALKYLAENTTDPKKKKEYDAEIERLIRGPKGQAPGAASTTQPAQAAQAAVPEGTTAVNPTTKQRIIMRNGKWEPVK
jgi:hypothetical protein